jgi:prepilin-type N-terminal cleavage/methylation domain-containing protein
MKNRFDTRRARGYSLMEISVVLVILALLGFSLWKLIPALDQVGETDPAEAQLALADEAVIGFIMREHRLPCPDTTGNGEENVSDPASGGCALRNGAFPSRTLGLRSFNAPLNYGVYLPPTGQSLTRLIASYAPPLPPPQANTSVTEWPLTMKDDDTYDGDMNLMTQPPAMAREHPTAAENTAAAGRINGLDFCARLRQVEIIDTKSTLMTSGDMPVAYVIAHPGAQNADGAGAAFDGGNEGPKFAAPHQPASSDYDDQVLATGFSELAARLSCPAYLSRVNAAGNAAWAAYDHYRFALAYLQYRNFALDLAYGDLQGAETDLILGVVGLAGGILGGVASSAIAIITADEALGAVVAGLGAAMVAISTALAIAEFILGLDDAQAEVDEAAAMRIEAEAHARKMRALAGETALRALQLDEKGLRP